MADEKNKRKITIEKDEVLEVLWEALEQGQAFRMDIEGSTHIRITDSILEEMAREGLIQLRGEEILFSDKGREAASQLIRAHRLAERLFVDVLDIKDEQLESNACTFEHILSPEVTTAICSMLGHPRECPHGKPIPPGACCRKDLKPVDKLVYPVTELKAGESGKVLYITIKQHARLDQLMVMGIAPGAVLRVHQTFPAYVLQVGETSIAIDTEICGDIFVRKVEAPGL